MGGVIDAHIAHLERKNLRPETVYQRRRALARLARTCSVLDATTEQLVANLDARDLSPQSRRTEIMHWAGFFAWAFSEGFINADPTLALERPKLPRRLPRPMSDEDKDRALALAPPPIKAMLHLAAYAGLRACEIAGLRAEHLNWQDRMIHIEEAKGGQNATVPMSSLLVSALSQCDLPTSGWLFRKQSGKYGGYIDEPLKPYSVCSKCNEYLHSLGIESTLHTLRHWFGTNAYRASQRDLRLTQELLRHASPTTTAVYTFVDPREAAKVVDLLPA